MLNERKQYTQADKPFLQDRIISTDEKIRDTERGIQVLQERLARLNETRQKLINLYYGWERLEK